MLEPHHCGLIIVDVQGQLARLMHARDDLFRQIEFLIRGCQLLELPILWLEQNPAGLGETIPEIKGLLDQHTPISKTSFSGCGEDAFNQAVQSSQRKQWLVCGIEAHICVYQTVRDLIAQGYYVECVSDAIGSRSPENKELALRRMQTLGANETSVEMSLYELLKDSRSKQFKALLQLVKQYT